MSHRRRDRNISDGHDERDAPIDINPIDLTDDDEMSVSGPFDIEITHSKVLNRRPTFPPKQHLTEKVSTLRFCRLSDGTVIKPGDFVELEPPKHRNIRGLQSGDFLRVQSILKDAETDEELLRGHRMLRQKYCPRIFRETLNEVVMHLQISGGDNRPALVQGMVNIATTQVLRKRHIVLTEKPYPMHSFREQLLPEYIYGLEVSERKPAIFHRELLVCRWVWTSTISQNGKTYEHHVRGVYPSESTATSRMPQTQRVQSGSATRGYAESTPAAQTYARQLAEARAGKRVIRSKPSIEELVVPKLPSSTTKSRRYTYCDVCCGAGGAARGADNAGLHVIAGLDNDELAMDAFEENFPGAIPLLMDMHDFPAIARDLLGRPDFIHFSNPCRPFSPAHTRAGKDDADNIRAIDAIKPAIERCKATIVTLENTYGLLHDEHRPHFERLMRGIISAGSGYSVRWKVINVADHGVPQMRKRLFILAAKKGVPLPPFPKASHGPPENGLKPYVSIGSALLVLNRLGDRAITPNYHEPRKMKVLSKPPYNAFSKLADCIITKGCATPHPSGTRDFTPVEFGQLQTLPLHHHFSGSRNEATRQAGNMVPALMQETILRLCAQTLEAFHHGLISAEDDIEDLDITLIEKGADIPELNPTPTSLLDLTSPPPPHKTRKSPPYRYLTAPKLSDAVPATFSSAFARRVLTHRPAPQARTKRACPGYGLGQDEESESPDSEESETSSVRRRKRRARKTSWTEDEDGNIVIDSD